MVSSIARASCAALAVDADRSAPRKASVKKPRQVAAKAAYPPTRPMPTIRRTARWSAATVATAAEGACRAARRRSSRPAAKPNLGRAQHEPMGL